MTDSEFKSSLAEKSPPKGLNHYLEALWYDAKGDWSKAHSIVDGPTDRLSARVHAYLHRKEGDIWNADYWYRRAGESRPEISLEEEAKGLLKRFLDQ